MRPEADFAVRDIAIGEQRLHVVRSGSGPIDVVYEAGGGQGSEHWLHAQRHLTADVTNWSYDRLHEPGSGTWSLATAIADLQAWLTEVGVRRPAVFVGHSLGCHILRAYTAQDPDAVGALLLVDPRPPGFEKTVLAEGIPIAVPPADSPAFREITQADRVISALTIPSRVRTVVVRSEHFDAAPGDLTEADAARVDALWRDAQEDLVRSIGQEPLVVAPKTGHQIATEAPDFLASIIRRLASGRPLDSEDRT